MTVIIKKYANRRLYDTTRSEYVTLDDLYNMLRKQVDFVVQDAKTGADLTKLVLTQIIFEREVNGGENILPVGFLKQLIGFYDDNLGQVLPKYLEEAMQMFVNNQDHMRSSYSNYLDSLTKSNLQIFEGMLKLLLNPTKKE